MPLEFDVHISEKLLQRLLHRRLLLHWPRLLIAVGLIGISLVLDARSKQWGVVSIAGIAVIALLLCIYAAVYVWQTRAIAAWKSKQGTAPLHYAVDEAAVRAQSNLGSMELKWTAFRELIEYRDCLLLCLSSSNHLTLPLADVPAEAVELIRKKFKELKLPIKKK